MRDCTGRLIGSQLRELPLLATLTTAEWQTPSHPSLTSSTIASFQLYWGCTLSPSRRTISPILGGRQVGVHLANFSLSDWRYSDILGSSSRYPKNCLLLLSASWDKRHQQGQCHYSRFLNQSISVDEMWRCDDGWLCRSRATKGDS
jgi:hypothetical protein